MDLKSLCLAFTHQYVTINEDNDVVPGDKKNHCKLSEIFLQKAGFFEDEKKQATGKSSDLLDRVKSLILLKKSAAEKYLKYEKKLNFLKWIPNFVINNWGRFSRIKEERRLTNEYYINFQKSIDDLILYNHQKLNAKRQQLETKLLLVPKTCDFEMLAAILKLSLEPQIDSSDLQFLKEVLKREAKAFKSLSSFDWNQLLPESRQEREAQRQKIAKQIQVVQALHARDSKPMKSQALEIKVRTIGNQKTVANTKEIRSHKGALKINLTVLDIQLKDEIMKLNPTAPMVIDCSSSQSITDENWRLFDELASKRSKTVLIVAPNQKLNFPKELYKYPYLWWKLQIDGKPQIDFFEWYSFKNSADIFDKCLFEKLMQGVQEISNEKDTIDLSGFPVSAIRLLLPKLNNFTQLNLSNTEVTTDDLIKWKEAGLFKTVKALDLTGCKMLSWDVDTLFDPKVIQVTLPKMSERRRPADLGFILREEERKILIEVCPVKEGFTLGLEGELDKKTIKRIFRWIIFNKKHELAIRILQYNKVLLDSDHELVDLIYSLAAKGLHMDPNDRRPENLLIMNYLSAHWTPSKATGDGYLWYLLANDLNEDTLQYQNECRSLILERMMQRQIVTANDFLKMGYKCFNKTFVNQVLTDIDQNKKLDQLFNIHNNYGAILKYLDENAHSKEIASKFLRLIVANADLMQMDSSTMALITRLSPRDLIINERIIEALVTRADYTELLLFFENGTHPNKNKNERYAWLERFPERVEQMVMDILRNVPLTVLKSDRRYSDGLKSILSALPPERYTAVMSNHIEDLSVQCRILAINGDYFETKFFKTGRQFKDTNQNSVLEIEKPELWGILSNYLSGRSDDFGDFHDNIDLYLQLLESADIYGFDQIVDELVSKIGSRTIEANFMKIWNFSQLYKERMPNLQAKCLICAQMKKMSFKQHEISTLKEKFFKENVILRGISDITLTETGEINVLLTIDSIFDSSFGFTIKNLKIGGQSHESYTSAPYKQEEDMFTLLFRELEKIQGLETVEIRDQKMKGNSYDEMVELMKKKNVKTFILTNCKLYAAPFELRARYPHLQIEYNEHSDAYKTTETLTFTSLKI